MNMNDISICPQSQRATATASTTQHKSTSIHINITHSVTFMISISVSLWRLCDPSITELIRRSCLVVHELQAERCQHLNIRTRRRGVRLHSCALFVLFPFWGVRLQSPCSMYLFYFIVLSILNLIVSVLFLLSSSFLFCRLGLPADSASGLASFDAVGLPVSSHSTHRRTRWLGRPIFTYPHYAWATYSFQWWACHFVPVIRFWSGVRGGRCGLVWRCGRWVCWAKLLVRVS